MTLPSRKSAASWNLVFQIVTILTGLVNGIVMVPLYLAHIQIDRYGAWLASGGAISLIVLVDPGVSSAVQRRSALLHGSQRYNESLGVLSSGLLLTLVLAIFIIPAGYIIKAYLPRILNIDQNWMFSELIPAWSLAICGSTMMLFVHIFVAFGNATLRSKTTGAINAISWIASLTLCYFLLKAGYGLIALGIMPIAQASTSLVAHISTLAAGAKWKALRPSTKEARMLLNDARSQLAGRLTFTVAGGIDNLIAANVIGAEGAASLSLMRRLPDTGKLFLERPCVAVLPSVTHLLAQKGEDPVKTVLVRIARWYLWLSIAFLVAIQSIYRDFISIWIGPQHWLDANLGLGIACASLVAATVANIYNTLVALGYIQKSTLFIVSYSILYIISVTTGGYVGGAKGFMIGCVVAGVLCCSILLIQLMKKKEIPRETFEQFWCELTYSVLAGLAAILVSLLFRGDSWTGLATKTLVTISINITVLLLCSKRFQSEIMGMLEYLKTYAKQSKGYLL